MFCLCRACCRGDERTRSALASSVTHETSVLPEVPDRTLRLAEGFVKSREVVVAVGELGVSLERPRVSGERRGGVPEILEQHAVVEEQQRIGTDVFCRPPAHLIRLPRPAALRPQPS